MSIKMMTEVWTHSRADGTALVLMLKLADFANDDGRCWPGVDRLAQACRRKRRQTQSLLAELVELGELEIEQGKGANHTNRYRIIVKPTAPLMFHDAHTDAENCIGAENRTDADTRTGGMQNSAPAPCRESHRGDAESRAHVCSALHPIHQEPSVKPREREKALSLSEQLSNFLKHCLLPDTMASRAQWQTLARNYGGAKLPSAILDCICWCIDTAQGDGLEFKYSNQVMSYARRWARDQAKASA